MPISIFDQVQRTHVNNSYAVIGLAVGGAGWYLGRLAQGPSGKF